MAALLGFFGDAVERGFDRTARGFDTGTYGAGRVLDNARGTALAIGLRMSAWLWVRLENHAY